MEDTAQLINALSTLLWPLIVIIIFFVFQPAVAGVIESARSRKFNIKIGGQELSMEEANEQQQLLIADLQSQIAQIKAQLGTPPVNAAPADAMTQQQVNQLSSVLWVDDIPKNNSYFVEALNRAGVNVDLALTTSEGLSMLRKRKYNLIISDMGRREDGQEHPRAGLELLKAVRQLDAQIPFYIFCSSRAASVNGDEAMRLGANAITSSPSELYALLNLEQISKRA